MGFGEYLPKQKTEYTVKTEPVQMQPQQADGNAFPITEEVRTDEKVKQAEPITETREKVAKQMPAVETQVILDQTMFKTNLHFASARLSSWERKDSANSERMTKIKDLLKDVSALMEEQMPSDGAYLQGELEKRYALYDLLVHHCDQYENEKWFTFSSVGRHRRAIIKELCESAKVEKEKLRASFRVIYDQSIAQKEAHKNQDWQPPEWSEVLAHARSEQMQQPPEGFRFLKKGRAELKAAKKSAAVYRLASFLNMGDAVEEVKPAVIKKDNRKEEQGFLVEDSVHKTLKDLNEESGGARITYDQKAIYDLMRIREMDKLLWITRKDEDLSLNWTVENGEYIVHSVKAIHNGKLIGKGYLTDENDFFADGKLANRILAVPKELINGMFVDVLDKDVRTELEKSFVARQKVLDRTNITYLRPEQYRSNGKEILRDLVRSEYPGLAKQMSVRENVTVNPDQKFAHQTSIRMLNQDGYDSMLRFMQTPRCKTTIRTDEGKLFLEKMREWEALWSGTLTSRNRQEILDHAKALGKAFQAWKVHIQKLDAESQNLEDGALKELEEEESTLQYVESYYKSMFEIDTLEDDLKDDFTDSLMDDNMLKTEIEYRQFKDLTDEVQRPSDFRWADRLSLEDRSNEPLFAHVPTVSDVCQGGVGDCYLLSALMTIVERNPALITNMMIDQGDRVKVIFPTESVVVSKKILFYDDKEKGTKYAYGAKGELWVQIMEKAYLAAGFHKIAYQNNPDTRTDHYIQLMTDNNYWNCLSSIGGGWSDQAMENLLLIGGHKMFLPQNTVDVMHETSKNVKTGEMIDSPYDHLWNTKVTGTVEQTEYPQNWPVIKAFLTGLLQDPLDEELKRRYSSVDSKGQRVGQYVLTIEDVTDTLKDMRGWHQINGKGGYQDFFRSTYSILKDHFGMELTQGTFDSYIELIAKEMEFTNEDHEWGFQHRSDPKSPQPKYGKRAKRTVDLIKRAQLEHTPITASTTSARIGNHDGLNGEMVENGISHSHTYMVDGYVEKEDGHIFIKLVNPWGIDVPQYGTVTEVDGRTHQTTVMNQDASTEGNFELELNDFMAYFRTLEYTDSDYDLAATAKNAFGGNKLVKRA